MTERDFAIDVVRRLREAGFQALWAGGCVRDQLLGLSPKDFDVATDARPDDVQRLFRRTVAVGVSFGVVEVLGPPPLKVQVATFRADVSYSDGRRPDAVVFTSAREDALRRDFTINGMFFDPLENQVIDYVEGQKDLEARVLRAIGEPAERFAEDKLRLLRAVRFATHYELSFDLATASALRAMANQISVVSAERIAEELRRLLVDPHRQRGMELFMDMGLAQAINERVSLLKAHLPYFESDHVLTLAYNVLTAMKRLALPAELLRARPKRLRFLIFYTPGKLVHHARNLVLRLTRTLNRFSNWRGAFHKLPLPVPI